MASRATVSRHPVALAGMVLTTVSAAVFIALVAAEVAGLVRNPYAGLIIYLLIPALFVLGLLLIPLGAWLDARARRRHPGAPRDWPVLDFRSPSIRRRALLLAALTAVNVVIIWPQNDGDSIARMPPDSATAIVPGQGRDSSRTPGPQPAIGDVRLARGASASGWSRSRHDRSRKCLRRRTPAATGQEAVRPVPPLTPAAVDAAVRRSRGETL